DPTLGIVVGFSLWFTITSAASVGSTLPLIFSKIGVDPAIASGPFITTAVDIFSLLIYFSFGSFVFSLFH
ncbi:MAG TPA: magnesium transporter, partial [Candidatus Atribacteria bacterium]|nr:magnesium transporter [Candidatus Atribacteria bacterium]